jgi:aminomethyltransferase
MVEFGGWDMPIQYTSVIDEHMACREDAVVFDVSHLGTVLVRGSGAHTLLQWAFTNDLDRIGPGRAQYTHLLDPDDAHVVDDIIVWWLAPDVYRVMPNASNTADLTDALQAGMEAGMGTAEIVDVTAGRAVLAVQGPAARAKLATIAPTIAEVARFHVTAAHPLGVAVNVAGTGYTGEDGVEIEVAAEHAAAVWDAVVASGCRPAGLGARDTLRLEAALPLHGHELGPGITPLQAGLAWVVRFDKGDFRGRAALLAERERGVGRQLIGMRTEGRQPPRAEMAVHANGTRIGTVTSGNYSPVLGCGIALALVAGPPEIGGHVEIDMRGRAVPATRCALPFVRRA